MAGTHRIQRAVLATLCVLLLATGCGRLVPGAASVASVIRDPDNPYFSGYVPTAGAATSAATVAGVVRDPDNPYWLENPFLGDAARATSPASQPTVRDPENPYWTGR